MVVTNNEMSTFVSVLSGGLNVLFLQGKNYTFDYRFLGRSIMQSHGDPDGRRRDQAAPAQGDKSEIDDGDVRPGQVQRLRFLQPVGRLPDAANSTGFWSRP